MGFCTPNYIKWMTLSVSLFFVIFGTLTAIFWKGIFNHISEYELSVVNRRTQGFIMWKETPIPMYMKFYLWNWTNSEEVIAKKWKNVKLKFNQCGPYVFHEHHIRENITFNTNYTLTYQTKKIFQFRPDLTVGSLDDKITTLNPIAATIAYIARDKHYLVKRGINFFFEEKKVELALTKTANEFLFDGYKDPMLDLLHKLNISGINVPFDKFGWFYARNGSADYDGVFNMYDGGDDIRNLGRIVEWNYNKSVDFFGGDCAKVGGTSGELWYPPRDDHMIKVFASDICGSVRLNYTDNMYLHGLKGHKYVADASIFDNSTTNENSCFVRNGLPTPSGTRNVSECKFGAPAFISFPHYYLADPSYTEMIEGMNPNPHDHTFDISLEPNTGLPLKVHAALQINLLIDRTHGINIFDDVKRVFVPMLWFENTAELSEDLANEGKMLLVMPSVGQNTGYGLIGIGCLLLVTFSVLTYRKGWRGTDSEQLISQDSF